MKTMTTDPAPRRSAPPAPEPDEALVLRARGGDADAFAALVRRWQGAAYAVALSLLDDRAEAEDMAQEAFVRAWRNLDLLADPARFGPWLRRITFGVCIDWLRAFRPELYRGGASSEGEMAIVPAPEPSPLEHAERVELAEGVMAAVARLPDRYRTPLTLFHLDGLSHERVAEALGVPVGTVRSLVTRARRKLAPFLRSHAGDAVHPPLHSDEVFDARPADAPRLLHVLNGDVVGDKLRAVGIPGTLAVWADVLHEGPVPADLPPERMREVRARHIAASGYAPYEAVMEKLAEWDAGLARFREFDEVVLWFEHDLFDQLLLARHLDWLAGEDRGDVKVALILVGAWPGIEPFLGLGQLSPDQLASLLDTRQRVTARQLEIGHAAWRAFTAPEPEGMERFLEIDSAPLPFLAPALRRHLQEFPWTRDGLSRTERTILEEVERGTTEPVTLFRAVQGREDRFFLGDVSFWRIVREMADARAPLLHLTTTPHGDRGIPDGEVRLTDAGRDVLGGRADAVHLNGIDRWLGGVHLRGEESDWRWDEDLGKLRRMG